MGRVSRVAVAVAAITVTPACGGDVSKEGVRGSQSNSAGSGGHGGVGVAPVGDGGRSATGGRSSTVDGHMIDAGSPTAGDASVADATTIDRRYVLTESRTLLPPRDGGVGITVDGSLLSIFFALDGEPSELVLLDPEANSVVKRLACPDVTGGAGVGVYGLAYEAGSFWVSLGGNKNELIRVSDEDCSIQQRFGSPSELGPIDLELDTSGLFITTGTGMAFLIDPATAAVKNRFGVGDSWGRDAGNAMRDGELWVASMFSGDTRVFNPGTGTLIGIASGRRYPSDGASMCFFGGQLVTLTDVGITFYDVARK